MPEVRRAAGKTASALALLAALLLLHVGVASAASIPPEVYMLATAVAFYAMNGDVKDASTYSTLLCQALAALPAGILQGESGEAYQLAYLASIRAYAPGYVDYRLMQLVYAHLADHAPLEPRYCGSAAPPASQPQLGSAERLAKQALSGASYDNAYRSAETLVSKSAENLLGGVERSLLSNESSVPPPPKPVETGVERPTGFNLTRVIRLLSKLRGVNITPIASGQAGGAQGRPGIAALAKLLGKPGRGVNLANIPSLNLSLGGGLPGTVPSMPSIQMPSFRLTLPPMSIPSIDPTVLLGVAALVAAMVVLWRGRELASRVRIGLLRSKVERAARRGDIDALIEAFAALLEEIGERCRPKAPDETHREYAAVLTGEALREYLRAALAYEAAKFGGKLDRREAVRVVREAAERLAKRIECREGEG